MKLNIGSNTHSIDGYTNVDIVKYPNVDVVADVCKELPFDDGAIEEIYAGHLLEHLERPISFLLECHRVLEDSGKLGIVVPNAFYVDEDANIDIGILFGFWLDDGPSSMNPSDMHCTFWSLPMLICIVEHCGFRFTDTIDKQNDPRLVTGADWHVGAEFVKADLDPVITKANDIHKQIMEGNAG